MGRFLVGLAAIAAWEMANAAWRTLRARGQGTPIVDYALLMTAHQVAASGTMVILRALPEWPTGRIIRAIRRCEARGWIAVAGDGILALTEAGRAVIEGGEE